jgi:hypothetical protein
VRTRISPATESALKTWAAQKRSLYLDISQPIASVLGKIKVERCAAGEGDAKLRQKWPEIYTADGLAVERVVRTLRELPRLTITYHFVLAWPWRVPIGAQAADLGIPRREYWRQLEIAEAAVDTGLQMLQEQKSTRTPLTRYATLA